MVSTSLKISSHLLLNFLLITKVIGCLNSEEKGALRRACKWKLQQGILYVNEWGVLISMQLKTLTMINMLEYLSTHKGTHLCVQVSSINPLFEIVLRPSITLWKYVVFLYFIGLSLVILKVELKFPKITDLIKIWYYITLQWSLINTPIFLFMYLFNFYKKRKW